MKATIYIVAGVVAVTGVVAVVWFRRQYPAAPASEDTARRAGDLATSDLPQRNLAGESAFRATTKMAINAVRGVLLQDHSFAATGMKPAVLSSATPELPVTPNSRLRVDLLNSSSPVTTPAKAVALAIVPSHITRH